MEMVEFQGERGNSSSSSSNSKRGDGLVFGECLSSFVDRGSIESHRYFLARRTLLEMLKDREYVVPSSEIKMTIEEFRERHGQQPDIDKLRVVAVHRSDPSKKIEAMFCGPLVLKVNAIRGILMRANMEGVSGLILVLENKITDQAKKAAQTLPFKVEIFEIADLFVNITKHVLQPRHQILTDQEKERLLKKYNIEEKQLPRMSQKDALAQYYGLQKGQVVKVTYSGEVTGLHVTYRCVW